MAPIATPDKTTLEGLKDRIRHKHRISKTERKAKRNAMLEVAKGLPEEKKLSAFLPKLT